MTTKYSKLFQCNVHGSIRVSGIAMKIINTPEFQRLRDIKQLGFANYVFPTSVHTRFEHSIGVYYLAGKMLKEIKSKYPDKRYDISELAPEPVHLNDKIIECIKIAGLCHDIGHGPFSHLFDSFLSTSKNPNRRHETRSCVLLEILCRRELTNEFTDNYISFMKSIIDPQLQSPHNHKGALYQIIANGLNGIDVDKFDYLSRDSMNTGCKISFNFERLIKEFIIDHNDNIAYPKHSTVDIYELFYTRYMMHKKVYSHKTVIIIYEMLKDVYKKVDHIFGLSESINDMKKFCSITDNTVHNLMQYVVNTPNFMRLTLSADDYETVVDANNIYSRIFTRDLYHQVLDIQTNQDISERLKLFVEHLITKHNIPESNIIIKKLTFGFVSGNNPDPFNSIYFYNRVEDQTTFKVDKTQIIGLINNNIQEIHWHLICKDKLINDLILQEYQNYQLY